MLVASSEKVGCIECQRQAVVEQRLVERQVGIEVALADMFVTHVALGLRSRYDRGCQPLEVERVGELKYSYGIAELVTDVCLHREPLLIEHRFQGRMP